VQRFFHRLVSLGGRGKGGPSHSQLTNEKKGNGGVFQTREEKGGTLSIYQDRSSTGGEKVER